MITQLLARILHIRRKPWTERHFTVVLVSAGVIAATFSLAIGALQSVWFDEAYSVILAKQPVGELLRLTSLDTHPPFYYLLLKAWAGIFGWSELALRSLSAIAAGGAVVFAGLLVKKLFGMRAAIMSLLFIVLTPFLLRYGFEIRMYALASLIGIAATYTLVSALQAKGNRQWVLYIVYGALVALGVYTLYYTVLLWLAHLVWLVWHSTPKKRPVFKVQWLAAFGVSIVLFLPWLPTFMSQISNGALAPISRPMTLENLLGIVSFGFVYQPVWQLDALVSLLVVFVLVTVSYFVAKAYRQLDAEQRPYFVLMAFYVLVPVVILTLVSLIRPMYVERYLAHVLIGGMAFIGVCVAVAARKASPIEHVAGLLLPVVLLVGVAHLVQVGNFNFQRMYKPMAGQAAVLLEDCKKGATIMAADPYIAIELSYYLPLCEVHFYSEMALKGGYAPLSQSSLAVTDPSRELPSNRPLLYVYFDEPSLSMPGGMTLMRVTSYGPLRVASYAAE